MIRLLRSGANVLWQMAFGFDYPSAVPPSPPIPPIPVDVTGDIDYYRRYLIDVAPVLVGVSSPVSVVGTIEDISYYRNYLSDVAPVVPIGTPQNQEAVPTSEDVDYFKRFLCDT